MNLHFYLIFNNDFNDFKKLNNFLMKLKIYYFLKIKNSKSFTIPLFLKIKIISIVIYYNLNFKIMYLIKLNQLIMTKEYSIGI